MFVKMLITYNRLGESQRKSTTLCSEIIIAFKGSLTYFVAYGQNCFFYKLWSKSQNLSTMVIYIIVENLKCLVGSVFCAEKILFGQQSKL